MKFSKIKSTILSMVVVMGLLPEMLSAQDVNINLNNPRQTIDGAGFCHEGDRMNGNYYIISPAIQEMLDNDMSLFRDMFPNRTFDMNNTSSQDVRVTNCMERLKYMQDHDITTILGIWDVPDWLVYSRNGKRAISNINGFADFITAFFVYGKNHYGLTVDYVDVNETKYPYTANLEMTSSEYISLIQALQTRFANAGIATKCSLGSILIWDIDYDKAIYNGVKNLSVSGNPSFHSYRGGNMTGEQRENISIWEGWGAWQQQLDRPLWGTETEYDAYYWPGRNNDCYSWTGAQEMAVVYWRNFYVARLSTSAGWFWHTNYPSSDVQTAYMRNFRPGGQVVETSQPYGTTGNLLTIAYKHEQNNSFVMHVLNEAEYAQTVTFNGLPSGKTLSLWRTSASGQRNAFIGTFTPNGSTLQITLPANTFSIFTGELGEVEPPVENIALNKPVTVSSLESGSSNTGANAVDGNNTTRWSSAFSDPQWIYVDLQNKYDLNRIVLNWEAAYGSAYCVEVSNDATNWTSAYCTTTGNGGIDDLQISGTGRYLRINGTSRGTQWGYSLWEIAVYGDLNAGDTVAPSVPLNFISTIVTTNSVTVDWGASTDNVAVGGYDLYDLNNNLLGTTNSTTYTLQGLTQNTTYSLIVKAFDTASPANYSGPSSTLLVKTNAVDTQAPTIPMNFKSTSVTTNSVLVTWDGSTDNVAIGGYDLYDLSNNLLGTTNSTSFTLQNLTPNTTYSLIVKAFDTAVPANYSSPSSTLQVKTNAIGVVTVYQNCTYGGYAVGLNPGNYTLVQLQNLGVLNDDISSVEVQSGYQVTLYQGDNFSGTALKLTASDNCLVDNVFNDVVTSVIVSSVVQTIYIQAEAYSNMSGVQKETTSDSGGGQNVGWIDAGDWMSYSNINVPTSGSYVIAYRVASANGGGSLRLESAGGGTNYGTVNVPSTGGWQTWTTVYQTVNLTAGIKSFGIKALTAGWNINWWSITPNQGVRQGSEVDLEDTLIDAEDIKAYPNPFSDEVMIPIPVRWSNNEMISLTIYDLSGSVIHEFTAIDVNEDMKYMKWNGKNQKGSEVSNGVYIYEIKSLSEKIKGKLLKGK